MVRNDDIVMDAASNFWRDPSPPALPYYNYHLIVQDLPLTFFPGARSFSPTAQRIPGTDVAPLANSSKQSYGQTDSQRTRFDKAKDLSGPLTLMAVAIRRPAPADYPLYRTPNPGKSAPAAPKAHTPVPHAPRPPT